MNTERALALLDSIPYATHVAILIGVLVVSTFSYLVAKRIVLRIVKAVVQRTANDWDDVILERGVFVALAWIAPALITYYAAYLFTDEAQGIVQRLLLSYILAVLLLVVGRLLDAANIIYGRSERSKELPIKGYLQVIKLILVLIGGIVIFAIILDQSPVALLSGLGAMTAIILLVFRDTILSFVASIQLATNDMVRLGDWVSMPQYGADGDVVDIALHVVKVQNWDKTITSIPTKAFIEQSFRNWRGMTESGGRRIKRAIALDATSIRFMDSDLIERLSGVAILADYLEKKQSEITTQNEAHKVDTASPINGRRMTNIGTFRAYVSAYLKTKDVLRNDMTFLVRQLAPGPEGVPIEVYVFSGEIRWAQFEEVQADLFDHLIAALPEFDLRIYQNPTGHDFAGLRASTDS